MREAYCPLCGVILQTFAGAQPPIDDLPWIAEIRAGNYLPIAKQRSLSPANEFWINSKVSPRHFTTVCHWRRVPWPKS